MTAPLTAALRSALETALGAEYRAVFGYGLLGPRLSTAHAAQAYPAQSAHARLRDQLVQLLASHGVIAEPPAPDYPDLYPVQAEDDALRLAIRLEEGCASAWRYGYAVGASERGASASAARSQAQNGLSSAAVRAAGWRQVAGEAAPSVPFPGL